MAAKQQTSLLPQNIQLTDEEEQMLDDIWAEIAQEDGAQQGKKASGSATASERKTTPKRVRKTQED